MGFGGDLEGMGGAGGGAELVGARGWREYCLGHSGHIGHQNAYKTNAGIGNRRLLIYHVHVV